MSQHTLESATTVLRTLFKTRFAGSRVTGMDQNELYCAIRESIGSINSVSEGFLDPTKQRDLSIKFHWGHNHDFGDGMLVAGRMGDRHIDIIARFVALFGLPEDLRRKRILDIGVWTGGTSLLLAAMGAEVVALEEVAMYAETVDLLARAFGIQDKIKCLPYSLYDALPMFADAFDYVIYSGVIYHVSDPLLSLRMIFSSLKDGGMCFLETYGYDSEESTCRYEGPQIVHNGRIEDLNRGGWNYFVPSSACLQTWCRDVGFQSSRCGEQAVDKRLFAVASRTCFQDFCRAGFAQRRIR